MTLEYSSNFMLTSTNQKKEKEKKSESKVECKMMGLSSLLFVLE